MVNVVIITLLTERAVTDRIVSDNQNTPFAMALHAGRSLLKFNFFFLDLFDPYR